MQHNPAGERRAESCDAQGMREEHALWLKNSYNKLCLRLRSKGTPQISPFQEPPPHTGLARPIHSFTASFQNCKALPLCSGLNTQAVPVPSELPAVPCIAARKAPGCVLPFFPHVQGASDLGKDLHKMLSPLKSPKQGINKTSVMPGMSFPMVN